jgi:hypothetical protein
MALNFSNIVQALDYLIESEEEHYLEYMGDERVDGLNHIYMKALQAKSELLSILDDKRK